MALKVCVFGAGAVGGNLAARLSAGGAEVSVVARGAQLSAIARDGITVSWTGESARARVRASDEAATLGTQDLVIVTLKAHAIAQAAPDIARLIGPDTPVVFAVNGLPWWYRLRGGEGLPMLDPEGVIARHFDRARVVGGVVHIACSVAAPGHIAVISPFNELTLGDPDGGDTARLDPWVEVLNRGGIKAMTSPAIKQAIWRKLALNIASSPLAVLGGAALPALYAEPELAQAARDLLAETAAIAAAEGFSATIEPDRYLADAGRLAHKPSALQDTEAGRPIELAAMFEAPLAVARARGVAAPVLGLVTALLRVRAAARSGPAPSPPSL